MHKLKTSNNMEISYPNIFWTLSVLKINSRNLSKHIPRNLDQKLFLKKYHYQ